MSDHVYKKISIVGSSAKSIDDAIRNAVSTAGDSVENLRWFEVDEIRGHIDDDGVDYFQVSVDIGFTIEESK
ncbi:MAG: dodecin [Myxococcota bacterium]